MERYYVVVVNRSSEFIPLRHIVEWDSEFDEEGFKRWYYESYHQIDGDEFHFFRREEMLRFVESLKE